MVVFACVIVVGLLLAFGLFVYFVLMFGVLVDLLGFG